MAERIVYLTDAHKGQIEKSLRRLAQLRGELDTLEAAKIDCKEYRELCDFLSEDLQAKYAAFFPDAKLHRAKKGG